MPKYWIFKSEPQSYSFEDLRRDGTTAWSGVRNHQARNFMQAMHVGDLGLFYHSNIAEPALVGICRIVREAVPDLTQFDPTSEYFDPKATPEHPRWMNVAVAYERALGAPLTLAHMRDIRALREMPLLQRGTRLSVQPVTPAQWKAILAHTVA